MKLTLDAQLVDQVDQSIVSSAYEVVVFLHGRLPKRERASQATQSIGTLDNGDPEISFDEFVGRDQASHPCPNYYYGFVCFQQTLVLHYARVCQDQKR